MLRQESLYFCCFNGISVNLTEERDRGNMSNGLSLVYARWYSNLSTNHVGMPHQALIYTFYVSNTLVLSPFREYYAKLYFDAKHLEKGLNRVWWDFWFPFFQKKTKQKEKTKHFGQYWKLPKFSRLDPA